MTAARGVLWDLDGTLVDSAELHWLSWRDTLAREGHPITYQQFLDSFGQKNDRILPVWLGADTPVERMVRISDAKEAEYRRLAVARGLTALPGADAWVRRLHARGWKQAIASFITKLCMKPLSTTSHGCRCAKAMRAPANNAWASGMPIMLSGSLSTTSPSQRPSRWRSSSTK